MFQKNTEFSTLRIEKPGCFAGRIRTISHSSFTPVPKLNSINSGKLCFKSKNLRNPDNTIKQHAQALERETREEQKAINVTSPMPTLPLNLKISGPVLYAGRGLTLRKTPP
jgi:hypothetical protein